MCTEFTESKYLNDNCKMIVSILRLLLKIFFASKFLVVMEIMMNLFGSVQFFETQCSFHCCQLFRVTH